jgi:Domain of unknown function (DUF4345)
MDPLPAPSRRVLRGLLYIGGAVATAAGLDTVIRGARSVPGQGPANTALESELRYYGAFYSAYGMVVLRVAAQEEPDQEAVRAIAAALFFAGLARTLGWLRAGRPHPAQRALLAIELGAPPAVIAWLRRAV